MTAPETLSRRERQIMHDKAAKRGDFQ